MARVLVLCIVACASVGALAGEFDRSAHAQARHSEAWLIDAGGAARAPSYDFPTESLYLSSNLRKPHYESFECATDEGLEYRWPCNRPGSRD